MRTIRRAKWTAALLTLALATGCGSDNEEAGTITVSAYGEEFIEEGIPASAMDDGWSVDFSRFEVTIDDVSIAGEELTDLDPVDLTEDSDGQGQELGTVPARAGTHSDAAFVIRRVELTGKAEKDGETKSFSWTFKDATDYHACENETEVSAGANGSFQITVHADHYFLDSLVAANPKLLFQPLADADTDDDGEITQDELAKADIGAYDPGNDDEIDNLWSWLSALTKTLGHVDGEGHCHVD